MLQDLHLKASRFLAGGSSFLANMYCSVRICTVRCEKVLRNRKANSPKSTKVKKTDKRRLNYVPTYVLLFTV